MHLKRLRDDLLHVKERGYSPDPEERTAYDRLMLGDGDDCVEDALAVVRAARPDFLPEHVLAVLVRTDEARGLDDSERRARDEIVRVAVALAAEAHDGDVEGGLDGMRFRHSVLVDGDRDYGLDWERRLVWVR